MDLNHLSLDEIQVECEVRNIVGNSAEQFKLLNERLAAESKRLIPDKNKIHPRATKSLNYEFKVCVNKTKDLKDKIELILTSNNQKIFQLLSNCRSRGLHIFNRLRRIIAYSPKYGKRATTIKEVCENLLLLIEKVLSRTATADESLDMLKEIPTGDNESELEDSDCQDETNSKNNSSNALSANSKNNKDPLFKMPNLSVPPPNFTAVPVSQAFLSNTFPPNQILPPGITNANTGTEYLSSTQHISTPFEQEPKVVESRLAEISALINELKTDFSQPFSNSRRRTVNLNENDNVISPPQESKNVANRPQNEFLKYKPLPINQWGISFNGVSDKISIERFLHRAEFLAEQNHMPLEHLSVNLVTIMSGVAREYCWLVHETHRPAKTPWINLKNALIHRFKSSLNDYDIKGVMKSRKQNYEKNETFAEFFSDILGMSLSLNQPLSEPDLVNLLIENMRPGLHIELAGETFRNVSELEARCRAKEKAWNKQGFKPELSMRYQVPGGQFRRNISELPLEMNNLSQLIPGIVNPISSHQISPSYGGGFSESLMYPNNMIPINQPFSNQLQPHYHMPGISDPYLIQNQNFSRQMESNSPEYNISAFNPSLQVQNQSAQGTQVTRSGNTTRIKCYNCDNWGHSFLDCGYSNSGDFCTMCGKKGVLKPNCPSCWNRVGNYRPVVSMPGNTHLPGTTAMPPNPQKPNMISSTQENPSK